MSASATLVDLNREIDLAGATVQVEDVRHHRRGAVLQIGITVSERMDDLHRPLAVDLDRRSVSSRIGTRPLWGKASMAAVMALTRVRAQRSRLRRPVAKDLERDGG
jgi:hypothetical protein